MYFNAKEKMKITKIFKWKLLANVLNELKNFSRAITCDKNVIDIERIYIKVPLAT